MCQLFFAWRIKILTKKNSLAILVAGLSVASGLCAIGAGIAIPIVKELAHFDRFQVVGCLWLGLTALVDLLITVVMTTNLVNRLLILLCDGETHTHYRTRKRLDSSRPILW